MVGVSWIFFRSSPNRVDKLFRRAQLVSSALYSLGHGSNDAQKTMGIIWMLLIAAGADDARSHPVVGDRELLRRHCARDAIRRVAHRQDDGAEDHASCARLVGSLLRPAARLTLFIATDAGRACLDYAHHHGRDYWRGYDALRVSRRSLGCGWEYRVGVDHYRSPASRADLCRIVWSIGNADFLTQATSIAGSALRASIRSCAILRAARRSAAESTSRQVRILSNPTERAAPDCARDPQCARATSKRTPLPAPHRSSADLPSPASSAAAGPPRTPHPAPCRG